MVAEPFRRARCVVDRMHGAHARVRAVRPLEIIARLVEAITNVLVGYGTAALTQLVVFPWFGLPARVGDALAIGGTFTAVSIARSFAWRLFEGLRWP